MPASSDSSADAAVVGRLSRVAKAFASSQAEGLFALATERFDAPLPPSLAYWRDFAARYLTELCHTPETADAQLGEIPPPASAELATLLLSVPPMQGAEYLTEAALQDVWNDLDDWVRDQVASSGQGLSGFLKERAPLWHQVGRVCFHLAENRRDPDYPFAFLATYAPSLTGGARVQYQPLSKALQQYAGAKDKKTLVKLLSPVHLASQTSPLVKELVDSGDIYQPLAWTPRAGVPVPQGSAGLRGERRAGAAARLVEETPAAPRGRDHRRKRQKKFDAHGMLDFKVQLALGDRGAYRGRMARVAGRRRRAGAAPRPVGRSGPRQTDRSAGPLEESSKQQAEDGLSFIEGMRLLAGAPQRPGRRRRSDAKPQREWSFVHAGKWLGELLASLRKSREPGAGPARRRPEGDPARVSRDGRQLALVPVEPRAGRLPGRRHGAGQDDPSAGAVAGR